MHPAHSFPRSVPLTSFGLLFLPFATEATDAQISFGRMLPPQNLQRPLVHGQVVIAFHRILQPEHSRAIHGVDKRLDEVRHLVRVSDRINHRQPLRRRQIVGGRYGAGEGDARAREQGKGLQQQRRDEKPPGDHGVARIVTRQRPSTPASLGIVAAH